MIKKKILGIFVSILLIAVPVSSLAGTMNDEAKQSISGVSIISSWIEQAKLTALDGEADDWFGCSISIDGDYAIVGACYDDSEKGSAYIFKRTGTIWVQEAKLNAFDGKESDQFGCSVSIEGNYAIIGAYAKNNWAGAAYVFKRDGTTWEEKAKLTASDGSSGDYFGYSVSIDGPRVIVGAYGDDGMGTDSGSAYIFTRGCCGWEEAAKLHPSDGAFGDYFGYSVSIYEIRVIIGAFHDDDMGTDSGSAYIFNRTGATWVEEQKLNASDGETEDEFGVSVSINGNYAIVGAFHDDDLRIDSGSAYVFRGHNQPPNVSNITGPTEGKAGTEYTYKFISIDPDDDDVRYHIDWGDGDNETTALIPSDTDIWATHSWHEQGPYTIKATAEDNCGLVGPEATFKVTVTMPRNRAITSPFLNFLQNHPNLFPILRLLLQRLGLQ